jgi:hypothetical protein
MAEFGVGLRHGVGLVTDRRSPRDRHILEIRACREMPAASAQDDDANAALLGLGERIEKLDKHRLRHGVANLRPVQPDMQDAALPLK